MSLSAPLFSIIIPLHNKGAYILETLESLRQQSFENWECIIIENHSTDDSVQKVQSLQDSRIQLHITEAQGPCSARNAGIHLSKAPWILFLDADDLIPSHYLKAKAQIIHDQPGRGLYTCPWEERSSSGKIEQHDPFGTRVSLEEMQASSFVYPPFAIHTTVIHRNFLTPEFLWPEFMDKDLVEDAIFWFRLLYVTGIAFHDDTKAIYQTENEKSRNQVDNIPKLYESYEKIIKTNLQFLQNRKIKTTSRHAYYLYSFYQKMEKLSREQKLNSITSNAQANLQKIYPQLSPWDRLKITVKKILKKT
ncbi:MAG: glycosyltransferase family A protein [Verrucomicrobiota bacterium]